MEIWIARDNTTVGITSIFTDKRPVLDSAGIWYQPDGGNCQSLYDFMFPEINRGECIELVVRSITLL